MLVLFWLLILVLHMEIHSSHHRFCDLLLKPGDFKQIAYHPYCVFFCLPASLPQPHLSACQYPPNTYQLVRTSEPKWTQGLTKMRSSKLLHCSKSEWTTLTSFPTDVCLTSNKRDSTLSPSCLFPSLINFVIKINNPILTHDLKAIPSCTAPHKHGTRFILPFRAALSMCCTITRSPCLLFSE